MKKEMGRRDRKEEDMPVMKQYRRTLPLILALFVLVFCDYAYAFNLPDTGQTKCYRDGGLYDEIPCAGTGQDGEYSINPMSYTDKGNGTVTDNNTGLMWQQSEPGYMVWSEALTYCEELSLGDHSDWRLPSKKELIMIVDFSIPSPGPKINTTYFPNTIAAQYWSSSTYSGSPSYVWYVNFGFSYGDVFGNNFKYDGAYVRCVRGGEAFPSFTDNGNGTVTDNNTGLMWQQSELGNITWWGLALSRCEGLSLGGNTDWRLPNIKELESLNDNTRRNPSIDTNYFPNTIADLYWSSTTSVDGPDGALYFYFNVGYAGPSGKGDGLNVLCVRGGQAGSFNNVPLPTISQSFSYVPVGTPVFNNDPSQAKPIGVGSVATGGDTLSFQIGLNQFSGPVDIYLAIAAPDIVSDIYMIKSDLTLQPASMGLVPWMANTTGPIDADLFGDISGLPAAIYYLYLAVTPAGSLDSYYLWTTSFVIP